MCNARSDQSINFFLQIFFLFAVDGFHAAGSLQLFAASQALPVLGLRAGLLGTCADTSLQISLSVRAKRLRAGIDQSNTAVASHAGLRSLPRSWWAFSFFSNNKRERERERNLYTQYRNCSSLSAKFKCKIQKSFRAICAENIDIRTRSTVRIINNFYSQITRMYLWF